MMTSSWYRVGIGAVAVALLIGGMATVVSANHAWGTYHWARTANPFTVKLGDNVSSQWDAFLATASARWSLSDVLDTLVIPGTAKGSCRPTSGQVQVCSSKYGNNGWLGIASIWVSGDHITQGTVKLNDTYFNTPTYNKPAWRNLVVCQEIGHTFGLDHQDENFTNANLGTCMDYTNSPDGNQYPNAHDYEELAAIYAHLDTTTTVSQSSAPTGARLPAGQAGLGQDPEFTNASEWGNAIRFSADGNPSLYVRDLGNNEKVFTFVTWTRE